MFDEQNPNIYFLLAAPTLLYSQNTFHLADKKTLEGINFYQVRFGECTIFFTENALNTPNHSLKIH